MYLDIDNVSKSFQRHGEQPLTALENINLSIEEGEFVSLLGPSGCGKSTLLSMIAGLSHPSSGTAKLANQEITEPGPDKSMVFQEPALFPWMSVKEKCHVSIAQKYEQTG